MGLTLHSIVYVIVVEIATKCPCLSAALHLFDVRTRVHPEWSCHRPSYYTTSRLPTFPWACKNLAFPIRQRRFHTCFIQFADFSREILPYQTSYHFTRHNSEASSTLVKETQYNRVIVITLRLLGLFFSFR